MVDDEIIIKGIAWGSSVFGKENIKKEMKIENGYRSQIVILAVNLIIFLNGGLFLLSSKKLEVPIWERFLLTVKEASLYFNIGENKLHRMTNDYMESEYKFVIQNGGRKMIKRENFEKFLNETSSI